MSADAVAQPAPAAKVAPLRLPPITETKLENGLAIVVAERHDLPLVAVRLVVPIGATRDPKGKEGIASFTAGLLRRGTNTRTAEQVDDAIESIGGLLGVESGYESSAIAATVPSEHLATALDVIGDLARNAAFPKNEFDVARRRELAQLQQDLDDPSTVADRALVEYFYGKNHPYGHGASGSTASVKSFRLEDVKKFFASGWVPTGATLLLVGDIDAAAARTLAGKAFGDWKGRAPEPVPATPPERTKGVEILLVDKPDATQAQVRVVAPGIPRKDPSFYAQTAANTVIGGGFTSRLVDEIRVNRGLSYSVSTRVIALRDLGAISYATFTKSETVRELLDASFAVLGAFREDGPSADELEKAKRYVIGLYPSRVESIDQLAEALGAARVAGLPFDVIANYREAVAGVTLAQAAEAARRYPSTDGAKVVVVGNAAKIKGQLEGLGTVAVKPHTAFE